MSCPTFDTVGKPTLPIPNRLRCIYTRPIYDGTGCSKSRRRSRFRTRLQVLEAALRLTPEETLLAGKFSSFVLPRFWSSRFWWLKWLESPRQDRSSVLCVVCRKPLPIAWSGVAWSGARPLQVLGAELLSDPSIVVTSRSISTIIRSYKGPTISRIPGLCKAATLGTVAACLPACLPISAGEHHRWPQNDAPARPSARASEHPPPLPPPPRR